MPSTRLFCGLNKGNGSMWQKKNSEQNVVKNEFEVNDNFLNIIQPSAIDFDARGTALGENVGKIYAVTRYPFSADYGWMAPLCNLDGTATTVEFHYTEADNLVQIFNKQISEIKGNMSALKNESDRQIAEKKIKDLKRLIHRLSVKKEPVGYANIMLHIQAPDKETLEDRIKSVSGDVAVNNCNIKLLTKRQGKALKVIAPYGLPDADVSSMGLRNMPLSTFVGGFPMANPGLNDKEGYYLGKTSNGRIVICNPWLRGKDRTNSNWFISGVPGVGKSTAGKDVIIMEYAYGARIIILDVNNEFIDLALHPDINGDVLYCAGEAPKPGTKSARINPLQARQMAVVTEEECEDLGLDKEEYLLFHDTSSGLAIHIQHLRIFFNLYFGKEEFTAGVRARLEECLIQTYEKFGITFQSDLSKIPAEKWPVLTDLYQTVEAGCGRAGLSEYEQETYERLRDLLFPVGKGADQLWNGPTTLESNNDFVDLVTSGLMETDEKVKRAQSYNVLSWCNEEATRNRDEKVNIVVDEGYMYVDPDYPDIMKYMRNMSKQFRKFEAAFIFITHAPADILEPEVKRYGQAIIDNACYKLIMGCDGKNLEETQELLNLTDKEVSILAQKNRGQGIFFAGNTRMILKIDVCDEFLEMMGTAGGR